MSFSVVEYPKALDYAAEHDLHLKIKVGLLAAWLKVTPIEISPVVKALLFKVTVKA